MWYAASVLTGKCMSVNIDAGCDNFGTLYVDGTIVLSPALGLSTWVDVPYVQVRSRKDVYTTMLLRILIGEPSISQPLTYHDTTGGLVLSHEITRNHTKFSHFVENLFEILHDNRTIPNNPWNRSQILKHQDVVRGPSMQRRTITHDSPPMVRDHPKFTHRRCSDDVLEQYYMHIIVAFNVLLFTKRTAPPIECICKGRYCAIYGNLIIGPGECITDRVDRLCKR